jgi:hypothetical protein
MWSLTVLSPAMASFVIASCVKAAPEPSKQAEKTAILILFMVISLLS